MTSLEYILFVALFIIWCVCAHNADRARYYRTRYLETYKEFERVQAELVRALTEK